jgi:hypothetical protein
MEQHCVRIWFILAVIWITLTSITFNGRTSIRN